VRVNCAALPSTLIESELFGPERGAFTGAVSMRQGRFELADKGTIFLDEIGDLPLDLEAKLVPLPSPSAHVAAADRAHSGPGHADAPGPRLAGQYPRARERRRARDDSFDPAPPSNSTSGSA